MTPTFFATSADWRAWLKRHHETATELLVGFYKRGSGLPSITWPESVDAALCFGWIDGVRRRIDDQSYSIRFTPRKARSIWSAVNIDRVAELSRQELMESNGLKAFALRQEELSRVYAFERQDAQLAPEQEQRFRKNRKAWKYFRERPPWYRRTASWWVISAKRPETRDKRLATLIKCSEQNQTLPQLTREPADR